MALNAGQVPMPDPELLANFVERFDPAPDLEGWVRSCFIEVDGELENEDHAHLRVASIVLPLDECCEHEKGTIHHRHG